jgi:hypothetical protein
MPLITRIINRSLLRYAALPLKVRDSALPFIITSIPLMLSSLAGAFLVMPIVIALTAFLLFQMTKTTDSYMFSLDKQQARLSITFPLCTFIAVWGITLAALGRKSMMNGVVGPYCLLLLIACAPAFRWNASRTTRRVPLWLSFSLAGLLALAGSLVYAF